MSERTRRQAIRWPCSRALRRGLRLAPLLLAAMLVLGCGLFARNPKPTPTVTTSKVATPTVATARAAEAPMTVSRAQSVESAGQEGGTSAMEVQLSEGSEAPAMATPAVVTEGQPLTPEESGNVLDRLPPLVGEISDTQELRLPEESLPAPRPGETITQTFPPRESAEGPEKPPVGPLKVLRFSPEGDLPLAPFLSITFDQPMVALTSHADLAAQGVPVMLSPQPEGQWRWVGTKTLVFQPRLRFPMATEYRVEVPAGTTSSTGGQLAEAVAWGFTTPPPQLTASYPPDGPTVREPLFFVAFDQRVEPDAVLPTISVKAGGKAWALRLATGDELTTDKTVSRMAKQAGEGRWLAFKVTQPLPYGSGVTVNIGPGTPSAEGPRRTESAQGYGFSTYGPLRVERSECGWDGNCPPLAPWTIFFSNPLDEQAFEADMVRIEPGLPGAELSVGGNVLTIQGNTRGRTTYKVTLAANLRDVFGQTLEAERGVTLKVGSAQPAIYAPAQDFVVLDPASAPTYSVYTINYLALRVRAYAVQPEDWPAFARYRAEADSREKPVEPPFRRVLDAKVRIENEADRLMETPIDLRPLLKEGRGQVLLVIDPQEPMIRLREGERPAVVRAWVQASGIALDAYVDGEEMLAWATALSDGKPLAGVALALQPGRIAAATGADGLARLPLADPAGSSDDFGGYLIARLGQDTAILPESSYGWGSGWRKNPLQDEYRWYVFDDRQMYRPGEEVHVKGWVRVARVSKGGDALSLLGSGGAISWSLTDSRGNSLLSGDAELSALGGFNTAFTLPTTMNLGPATLQFTISRLIDAGAGQQFAHSIQVQEFRRPEFEVATSASASPHFAGGQATVSVKASYYAGGALPNAPAVWNVTTSPGTYRPPKWDDFSFGIWVPWWEAYGRPMLIKRGAEGPVWVERGPSYGPSSSSSYEGHTDASGVHALRLDFAPLDPPQPTTIVAEATVMDVNRQAWTASTNLLVHPAELYVGLRSERFFVEQGQPISVEAIVTDLDGAAVADRSIEMRAVRLRWTFVKGSWEEKEVDEQTCKVGSTEKPVSCTFNTPEGGTYRISATIVDNLGRRNLTQITRWVSGGQQPTATRVEQERATLVPDRQEYRPGETAEILVQSPFFPAEGLLTLRRSGIVRSERFRMDKTTYTLRVPIEEAYVPNIQVQVDLVGSAPRLNAEGQADEKLPRRPAYATGSLDLPVPPYARSLSLSVTPRDKELEPGGETTVDLLVKDAAGRPVRGAELAVVVVDEAVLALTNYQLADPLAVFYPQRYPGVSDYALRGYVLLVDPSKLLQEGAREGRVLEKAVGATLQVEREAVQAAAPSDMAEGKAASEAPLSWGIRLRSDLNPLAVFEPAVPTDADGTATVRVKVPDNLTRYRVMVVAVSGSKDYGKGDAAITARLPLMVRPSPPRFLNFGDKFSLPVVLQNQTDQPLEVEVAVRATNVRLTGASGQRVTVPARDRVEVRFEMETALAGAARFQVAAVSGKWADAALFELPVYTPATTEAFAVYGTVDKGSIAQPVIAPSGVYTQFGGLEISTSSTALQALTDAVLYLTSYPYECSEQLASRVLAVAALRDVLSAFKARGLPPQEELVKAVQRDIAKLQGMQNSDGGFPLWWRGETSWPFHSIHAAHALARAREKDFQVPEEMIASALGYLREIESHYPSWYSEDVRNTLTSYALYVRALLGDVDGARARKLVNEAGLDRLQPEAVGWLFNVLLHDPQSPELAGLRRYLDNRVVETAGAAHYATSYREDDGYLLLASNRRADGIILEALMRAEPQSELIPKIVRGLLAHRVRGRWDNTQDNVFILLALDRYFNTYEAQTPDFVARVWLGEQYVAGFSFKGRSTDYQEVAVPMRFLSERTGSQDLILSVEGQGRLYYRLGLSYAPTDLDLEPMDQGFAVQRAYEAVDDPADVRRDEQGVWQVRAGARVRVRLTMVAPTRRYHVALADPLPAGFESLNPALAVSGSIPQDPQEGQTLRYWWWSRTWYEHQNLRDERSEAFASLLWEGVHTYTYIARATTPGEFVAPPTKAEEMYSPEVFGRGGTDRVVVR